MIFLSNHYEEVQNYHRYLAHLFGGVSESTDVDELGVIERKTEEIVELNNCLVKQIQDLHIHYKNKV